MRPNALRLPLDSIVPVLVGATVVAFVAGSSSVPAINHGAKPFRWLMLFVLTLAAAAWARRGRPSATAQAAAVGAGAFVALALASALWSIDPRESGGRAVSLAVLFAAGLLLARAAAGAPHRVEAVLLALLAAAGAVAVAGLVVLVVDHAHAVQPATYDVAARYKGFGENPNTIPLLLALALPLAGWFALCGRTRAVRATALLLLLLFVGSIVAAGSRGALAAGFLGLMLAAALAPVPVARRLAAVGAVGALLVAALFAGRIPKPTGVPPAAPAAASAPHRTRYVDADTALPLSFDAGAQPSGRPLLGSSGRAVAWRGAIDDGARRPLLGYGFGTEALAFIDRYTSFQGDLPENSFIGVFLQLGLIGLAAFVALVVVLVAAMARGIGRSNVVPCLAVVLSGLALAIVQSYVYSVGNVGTATLWICAFMGAAAASRRWAAA